MTTLGAVLWFSVGFCTACLVIGVVLSYLSASGGTEAR